MALLAGQLLNATECNTLSFCVGATNLTVPTDHAGAYAIDLAVSTYTIKVNGGSPVTPPTVNMGPSPKLLNINGGAFTR